MVATLDLSPPAPTQSAFADPGDAARAAAGDQEAFARLYRAHTGRVFALCARMTADRALAEELTQDVFVRAWEKLPLFRGESAFGTWLHRLAVNVVLLSSYTLGCHSIRHVVGGRKDEVSKSAVRETCYNCSTALNYKHQLFAWMSLFSVAFSDVYVRLLSMGILHDPRLL